MSIYSNFIDCKKYHKCTLSLKKLIFPRINERKLKQLMIDNESIKYITHAKTAQNITNIIKENLYDFPCPFHCNEEIWMTMSSDMRMKNLVITEMTAGVGGNVLNFAYHFKYVNAIEIHPLRYKYLNNNINAYEYLNVNCYNDDSINLLINKDDLWQDIIFFDPPWGGENYKTHQNLHLKFGEYSIENICKIIFMKGNNQMIILKLPNNYDFISFQEELKDYRISIHYLDRLTLVLIKKHH
uniref:Trimethylguanosine synthase n=1 Tax=viral metagenome TaxID=1070528 RepID=A0A6C0LQN1_9ZZZZ